MRTTLRLHGDRQLFDAKHLSFSWQCSYSIRHLTTDWIVRIPLTLPVLVPTPCTSLIRYNKSVLLSGVMNVYMSMWFFSYFPVSVRSTRFAIPILVVHTLFPNFCVSSFILFHSQVKSSTQHLPLIETFLNVSLAIHLLKRSW